MNDTDAAQRRPLALTVNGAHHEVDCPDGAILVGFVRDILGLKGTHVGCMNGDCGACTVMVDGQIVKSCLVLARRVEHAEVTTIEGLAPPGELHPLQEAFWENDGFQCGFCTPGHLFSALDLLRSNPRPSDHEIRHALAGTLCRCTGYQKIVDSVRLAAERMAGDEYGGAA